MAESHNKHQDLTRIWQQLGAHQVEIASLHMRDMFKTQSDRASEFSLRIDELLIDFSKHRINAKTLSLLFSLAEKSDIENRTTALFSGENINTSEGRPALHPFLRAPKEQSLQIDGVDVVPLIHSQLDRMRHFIEELHKGNIQGASGKSINKVISIGIGGSDLGPRLVIDALGRFRTSDIEVEFVSNLDPRDMSEVLARANPETTMIIVVSKSFTTLETRTNAEVALQWLQQNGCSDLKRHLIAITTNVAAAHEFGASDDYIFVFWDWVGGRYSLWSSVGLSIAIAIGMENFEALLNGAHVIDTHFQSEPAKKNAPVILALLSIWYNNFFDADTHAVVPYDQSLRLLPEYLSQLVMESNGKSVSSKGETITHATSPILWGSIGTNAQHAFFQLLHQGTHLVPLDFLLPLRSSIDQEQQMKLASNCLAQSEALMLGQENKTDLNKHFPGNNPSTTIVYDEMSPRVLGMLLALYEHKTFVEAMIWDINPFDQWGVELGKKLATRIAGDLSSESTVAEGHDGSTVSLIREYRQRNK